MIQSTGPSSKSSTAGRSRSQDEPSAPVDCPTLPCQVSSWNVDLADAQVVKGLVPSRAIGPHPVWILAQLSRRDRAARRSKPVTRATPGSTSCGPWPPECPAHRPSRCCPVIERGDEPLRAAPHGTRRQRARNEHFPSSLTLRALLPGRDPGYCTNGDLIELARVSSGYDGVPVVRNLNLHVDAGELATATLSAR